MSSLAKNNKLNYFYICAINSFSLSALADNEKLLIAHVDEPIVYNNTNNQAVFFNRSFLNSSFYSGALDVSGFEEGQQIMPGSYIATINVNDLEVGSAQFEFKLDTDNNIRLCMNPLLIELMSIKDEFIDKAAVAQEQTDCYLIANIAPGIKYAFDSKKLVLNFMVPQIMLNERVKDYIPSSLWANGDYAAVLSYDVSHYESRDRRTGNNTKSDYASIDGKLHLGNWFLKHDGYWYNSSTGSATYSNNSTYLQTAIAPMQSAVKLGEFYTNSSYFNSEKIRGFEIYSDDAMLPRSQNSYAPVIRGTAQSNARVTIRQNNEIIYETTVSEGPFALTNVNSFGYGNFEVTVEEANGIKNIFIVPYNYEADLVRPGQFKYNISIGKLQKPGNNEQHLDNLFSGYVKYGLSNYYTPSFAYLKYEDYSQYVMGNAVSTTIGSFSLENSYTRVNDPRIKNSNSFRIIYNKNYPVINLSTNANFSRYSKEGMRNLSHYLNIKNNREEFDNFSYDGLKSELSLNINKNITSLNGYFYFNYYNQSYFNKPDDKRYQLGYSTTYRKVSYDINYEMSEASYRKRDHKILLSLRIPLGDRALHTATFSANHSSLDGTNLSAGINGQSTDNRINYAVNSTRDTQHHLTHALNGSYSANSGVLRTSYSQSNSSRQYSLGATGSVVAYPKGVFLSQRVYDTFAIIEADDAAGVLIGGQSNSRLNSRGKGVTSYMQPYQYNRVYIVPEGIDTDIQFAQTSKQIVPRANTVNIVRFETTIRKQVVMKITNIDKLSISMGAPIFDEQQKLVGYLGGAGLMFIENYQEQGILNVGEGSNSCVIKYSSENIEKLNNQSYLNVECL